MRRAKVTRGSGNVFADLGLPQPEERLAKVALALELSRLIRARGLTQRAVATQLGMDQPKVSHLLHEPSAMQVATGIAIALVGQTDALDWRRDCPLRSKVSTVQGTEVPSELRPTPKAADWRRGRLEHGCARSGQVG